MNIVLRTRSLDVRGESLLVREAGSKAQSTVFLMHSLGLSSELWMPQFLALQNHYHLVAMDCRGHGCSTNHGGFSVLDCAQDALAVMEALELESAHLVGISMGGLIVAELASLLQEKNHAACLSVTLACSYRTLRGSQSDERLRQTACLLETKGMEAFGQEYVHETLMAHTDSDTKVRMAALIGGMTSGDYLQTLGSILNHDAGAALSRLDESSTLLLHGQYDHRVAHSARQALERTVPSAQVIQLQGAGHLANVDMPLAFSNTLMAFWQGRDTGSGKPFSCM